MDWQSASAVKVRLIVQFLKYLRVEHTDNKVIRFVTIRDYTKQCCLCLTISIDSNADIRKIQFILGE